MANSTSIAFGLAWGLPPGLLVAYVLVALMQFTTDDDFFSEEPIYIHDERTDMCFVTEDDISFFGTAGGLTRVECSEAVKKVADGQGNVFRYQP